MPKVFISSVIDAPADNVWGAIRDFNGAPDWHPSIGRSELETDGPANELGAIRSLWLEDGTGPIRETLLGISDVHRSVTYKILESPLGLEGYVSTLSVEPVTDGDRSYVRWQAEFECKAGREEELVEIVDGVFQMGFDALKARFGG